VPGLWEGDLLFGDAYSQVATLTIDVEDAGPPTKNASELLADWHWVWAGSGFILVLG